MSAKGRAAPGYVPDPHGFFQTQPQVTRAILAHLDIKPGSVVLEPSCGKGAIAKVLRQEFGMDIFIVGVELHAGRARSAKAAKVELRPDQAKPGYRSALVFDQVIRSDFYKIKREDIDFSRIDICLTNPDFGIWLPFAEHCFKFSERTVLLLPANCKASKKRAPWWRQHPAHERILSKRPSFAISVKCVYANARRAHAAGAAPCTFQELISLDEKPKKECPICSEPTETTSSDASEYSWFEWSPSITRGLWDVIDTPEEA